MILFPQENILIKINTLWLNAVKQFFDILNTAKFSNIHLCFKITFVHRHFSLLSIAIFLRLYVEKAATNNVFMTWRHTPFSANGIHFVRKTKFTSIVMDIKS